MAETGETKQAAAGERVEDPNHPPDEGGELSSMIRPTKDLDAGLNDSLQLEKLCASVEQQLSLSKRSYEILGKVSEQLRQRLEESVVSIQRPVLFELVLLHDNLERAIEWVRGLDDISRDAVIGRLDTLQVELLEILARKDVRRYEEHPASLDTKLHRTMKTLPTAELSENNTVAQILRTGFFWGEKVLRPEEVVIKKYAIQEPPKGD